VFSPTYDLFSYLFVDCLTRSREAAKPRSREAAKPRSREAAKPRSIEMMTID
jgi:hypothetical protein